MSTGLWHRMRDGLLTAAEPLTARALAERIDALDELSTIRNILYLLRKNGAHVERIDPAHPKGEYRWRLLRDARQTPPCHRRKRA